jgi:PAS domain S-box-containing protein
VLDRELRYVRINEYLAHMNGIPVADHLGRRVRDLVPDIADRVEPILRHVLESGEPVRQLEVAVPGLPGTGRGAGEAFRLQCLPLRDAEQAIIGINVVVEDISEQRRTAERLQTAEQRLWLLTEHSPMAVIEWDGEYCVTRWGGAAESIFGWKAEEVMGVQIDRLNIIVEEDWPLVQGTMERLSAADSPHVVSSNRNYTKDRRVIVCEWYNSVLKGPDGRLRSVLSLVLDVTEQRRSEAEQRLLASASEILAGGQDRAGAIDRLVRLPIPAFADWCGLETASQGGRIVARNFAHRDPELEARYAPLHRQLSFDWQSRAANIEALRTGRPVLRTQPWDMSDYAGDDLILALARSLAPTSSLSMPLRVDDRTLGVWTWGRSRPEPFTPREVALAEELGRRAATMILNADLFDAIEKTNRSKDQFIATLGHELRQPLGALTMAVSLLRETATSDNSLRVWNVANRQLHHVSRLVDDLLDLTRIDRGKIVLQRRALDLRTNVNEAVESCAHLFREHRQQVEVGMPTESVPVVGDAARLRQVVTNLLTNACKFSPHGSTIVVTVEMDEEYGRIAVKDSGRGIARPALDSIFEPFAQTGEAMGGGLGIGLAVVRQLVELHQGTVTASSEGEGCGSEFVVLLPLAASEGPAPQGLKS